MSKDEFKNEVLKIFYGLDITVYEALEIAKKKFSITDSQFNKWFL